MSTVVATSEVHELLDELTTFEGRQDPYPTYAALRRLAPVARAADGVLVLSRYADCHALLRHPQLGHGDPDAVPIPGLADWRDHTAVRQFRTSLLNLDPPEHTRIRRLVSGVFTARRVAALRPQVEQLTAELVDGLGSETDFIGAFAFRLPIAVIGELLGVPRADQPPFQQLVRDWMFVLDAYTPEILATADDAADQIRSYLADLTAERRRRPQDDLLSALVAAEAAGERLSEDDVLTTAALLFSAGFETTTHLLGNGLVALIRSPDQLRLWRGEPDLAPRAVEELLRFDSPVQITGRQVLQDTEVAGVPVRAGERVIAYLGAANRDPDRFADPDRLDLTRADNAPLSFGGGIHYCLGAPLARLEAQVALPALFTRFADIALAGPAERRNSLTLRGYLRLPITLD